jgi:hypothetical protein
MKFIVEIPDSEVFDAAEQPEDLACEIADVIASEIFSFSAVSVIPLRRSEILSSRGSDLNSQFAAKK